VIAVAMSCSDQATLALADRAHQVDDPRRGRRGARFQAEALLRIDRGELVEVGARPRLAGRLVVDRVDADQGAGLPGRLGAARRPVFRAWTGCLRRSRGPGGSGEVISPAKAVLADLGEGDVDVVRARPVAGGPDEGPVVVDVEDSRHRDERGVAQALVLRWRRALLCSDGHGFPFGAARIWACWTGEMAWRGISAPHPGECGRIQPPDR